MATEQHSVTAHKLSAEQANLVRSALESVISSDAFAPSKRCQDFLRLVVEHALAGELDSLSERMIGAEMFRRLRKLQLSVSIFCLGRTCPSSIGPHPEKLPIR
jgi:hypothetical protein